MWHLDGDVDYIAVWANNEAPEPVVFNWNLTLAGGLPLPGWWNFSTDQPTVALEAGGSSRIVSGTILYTNWALSLFRLEIPEAEGSGVVDAEIRADFGDGTVYVRPVKLLLDPDRDSIAEPPLHGQGGDLVIPNYSIYEYDVDAPGFRGELIGQSGSSLESIRVGDPDIIVGLGYGMVGVGDGDPGVTVVAPPPYAYGYDVPEGAQGYEYNGQPIVIDISLINREPERRS